MQKNKEFYDVVETASLLGVSTATIRNWARGGYLKTDNNNSCFPQTVVKKLKSKIENGNFDKLNKRANKTKSKKTFIPEKYFEDTLDINELIEIVDFIKTNDISIFNAMLFLSLNLLKKEEFISPFTISDLIDKHNDILNNNQIEKEINLWISQAKIENLPSVIADIDFLLNCSIPKHRDIVGLIYQSILAEGKKAQNGSYYTPSKIVDGIVNDYARSNTKVFDPCCGTGQFLLSFADIIEDPQNIYGVDSDIIATKIARLNILRKYKNINFTPNIFCKNTLFEIGNYDLFFTESEDIKNFDIIATNPPWGSTFSKSDTKRLKNIYPEIESFESFSYFLKKSIDLLNNKGVLSFVLPESILNVKAHKDIRKIILKSTHIKKIYYLNRVFKNVFTPVIRLDLEKGETTNTQTKIYKENENYIANQENWSNNKNFVFNVHANKKDVNIIDKVYKFSHITLSQNTSWALGIVTGNNKKFISNHPQEGYEEIYKGKDVRKFALKEPSNYIKFTPDKFQQVAPIGKYRADEKLIYKFISKRLVFAYDNHQKLTLNSANIVIPKVQDYPMKVIAALFNSSLYQFIFQKKFSSIKVLRSHIEQLPLPLWNKTVFNEVTELVNESIKNKNRFKNLDIYIMEKFNLLTEEINYIKNFNKN